MKRQTFLLAAYCCIALLAQNALAGPVEDGMAAHQRGDFAEALAIWTPLAEQGDRQAQFAIGEMYFRGQGVKRNLDEAFKWKRLSALQGFARAQNDLATMYLAGSGTPMDLSQVMRWFRAAADQGDVGGQSGLAMIYQNGFGVRRDYTEAAKWYRLAADQGSQSSLIALARAYERGEGVEHSDIEAYRLYLIAVSRPLGGSELNAQNAVEGRDRVRAKLSSDEISRAEKLAAEWRPTRARPATRH